MRTGIGVYLVFCVSFYCILQKPHFLQIEGETLHQSKDYNSLKAQMMINAF